MSITVITARDENGAPTTQEIYASGVKYNEENGNLEIISAKPQLIATYGSGNWLSVHVGDNVEVITKAPESSDDDSDDFDFGSDDDDSSDDSDDSSDDSDDDDSSDDSDDDDSSDDSDSESTDDE